MGWVALLPTVTLPKLSGAGAIDNWPGAGAEPVPDNDSVACEFEALLTIDNAPEDEPLA